MKMKYILFLIPLLSFIVPNNRNGALATHLSNTAPGDSITNKECEAKVKAAVDAALKKAKEEAVVPPKPTEKAGEAEKKLQDEKTKWDAEKKVLDEANKALNTQIENLKKTLPVHSDAEIHKKLEAAQASLALNTAALKAKEAAFDAKAAEVVELKKARDKSEKDLANIKKNAAGNTVLQKAIEEAEKNLADSKNQTTKLQKARDSIANVAQIATAKADTAVNQKNAAVTKANVAQETMKWAIIAALVMLLIGGIYYVIQLKRKSVVIEKQRKTLETQNLELETKHQELEQAVGAKKDLDKQVVKLQSDLEQKTREKGDIQAVINKLQEKGKELGAIFPTLDNDTYFFAETMTSAGPRKSAEIGLGEDVTGTIIREDFACFWIFDGVSDNHILKNDKGEYFSSRLLAQSIALAMQAQLSAKNKESFDLKMALEAACASAREAIQKKINNLSAPEKQELLTNIRNRDIPTIATTALVALLTKQGDLKIYRIGVDKFVALPQGKISNPKTDGSAIDRIAFSLNEDAKGQLIVHEARKMEHALYAETMTGVTTVVGATDGVSDNLLNWLKSQKNLDLSNSSTRRIITDNRDKTYDDKSLCIIQIKSIN